MVDGHSNWTTMFFQILFLICSVCNTYGVASTASPSCTSDEYRAGQLCCLACPGGYRVHRDCTATANTKCSKCPDGTFKEGLSGQKQCSNCTKCDPGYRVHRDCTATTNSLCSKCPDGTFKEGLSGQKQCSACTKCDPGLGLKVKKRCTPTSDTECETRDGFFCSYSADKDTFSEATLSCQPHTICDSVGGVQIQPGTDSTDSTCLKYVAIAFIIIGCICFIISLVLGALFYRWLKMERDLTEFEKQIDEMETPDQVKACDELLEQLRKKKKTQKQERKFVELTYRRSEKSETLEMDWKLTELKKQINEMETPEQENYCYRLYSQLWSKKKTPEQNKKLERLYPRFLEKRKTLDIQSTEVFYRRCLMETQKWNKRSNGWIDQLLKANRLNNTENDHGKANRIREKQKKKKELDTELTELIHQLLEEIKEQERKITVLTDCPEPTRDQQEHTITIPSATMDDVQDDDQSLGRAPPLSLTDNGSVSVSDHQDHQPVLIKRDSGASQSIPLSLMRSSSSQSAGERVSLLMDNDVAEAEVTPVHENRDQPGRESDDSNSPTQSLKKVSCSPLVGTKFPRDRVSLLMDNDVAEEEVTPVLENLDPPES